MQALPGRQKIAGFLGEKDKPEQPITARLMAGLTDAEREQLLDELDDSDRLVGAIKAQ